MARSKLKSALERHKGRDVKLEKQRKKGREARKKKGENRPVRGEIEDAEDEEEVGGVSLLGREVKVNGKAKKNGIPKLPERDEWETDESENEDESGEDNDDDIPERPSLDISTLLEDSDSEGSSSDDAPESDQDQDSSPSSSNEEEEDIPLSDIESLASEDKGDVIPHQRLTINNTSALLAALNRISLPYSKLPFSEHQSITTDEPVEIPDVEDDLNRELAFYRQSLSAVKDAQAKLKKEGVPFSRPADYFAEMVKSDEHMGKIKQKLVDEAAGKKAAAEARRQRDLKKFGKQVQVARMQERAKEKRDTLEKINLLKRKRQGVDLTTTREEDLFDIELDSATKPTKSPRISKSDPLTPRHGSGDSNSNPKRQKKDAKYGFGGKKRHAKSNDAFSSADTKGFSHRKMKGKHGGGGGVSKRLGKSRRVKRV
ncbi:Ebp2-domain-containing protein [Lindgomyces ingoldianus]|uniref:Ebp2-domain-containing protein n=1 Tax=Lindgomyces ingoldianus TaxID=673940 RepID=A0ACB6QPH9_9PLEO|nr:Ebp2-domain-containing protein [Lindgomyces ingoldianus]KAF2468821.1 Ebp2-domain-containing protein [Lindgomyces ingoldianus]